MTKTIKPLLLIGLFVFKFCITNGQNNLTDQQRYLINELRDAYGGQINYAYNYPKTKYIYNQLREYSGMEFPVIFNQTFRWGVAHHGGLIILDYSTINKNEDILAFVFAHEWGHQALGHQANLYNPYGSTWKIRTSSTETEDEADFYAGKFLASYNYDVDVVYNYLSGLPEDDSHTHSSGRVRANTVLKGYRSVSGYPSSVEYEYITEECNHPAHPSGDISQCTHAAHYNGDIVACQHACQNMYGQIVPCHPNGDIVPCSHAAHPRGDISPCVHRAHPEGHRKKVRKY